MECNICEQQKTRLYCTKCVKEGVRQQNYQFQAVSRKKDEALEKVKEHLASDLRRIWQLHAERDEKKLIISLMRQEIERLHTVIRKDRQRLENVKTDVATRKSNLASALKGIKASHSASSTSLKAEITRVKERRENIHQKIAIARRSRCKEAAELLGLRRLKDDAYAIAGVIVVDLHLIRNYTPMYVVLGLSHIIHLVTLIADYLSLKLPYEIVPPSRGTPYHSIRKSPTTKSLPLNVPPDPSTPSSSKAWAGKKIKDMPQLESFIEAISLLAWDIAWVLWTQQLWPPPMSATSTAPPRGDAQDACRLAKNMYQLVCSTKIGRISHSSTIEFLPIQESIGILSPFTLSVKNIQDVISAALEEERTGGEADGSGWDMVEGGEEVLRGEGWLKLPTVARSES